MPLLVPLDACVQMRGVGHPVHNDFLKQWSCMS